ncbi:hypothetical protein [Actinoplanes awajinensis]|uniref:Uncharacterized protein n=1 Tax=Actinoplanes awajinensis subsp. mycoplanecinus TaxID=135947 RepID=A0A124GAE3_9ACTN|nr:hypothetical protein [Actinoplanes awajinensis]KUL31975.1 hypothetical protein ADL15_20945 [Actinoplanes awajinensis subsp. mycoplanecinus]
MASISAISSSSSSGYDTAKATLVAAQQKLAADTAAKAEAKVISEDKAEVTRSQKAVAQAQQSTGSSAAPVAPGRLDVTV